MKRRILFLCLLWIGIAVGQESNVCEDPSTCGQCPDDWDSVAIHHTAFLQDNDTCTVNFYWDYSWQAPEFNPLLTFICQYVENGETCNTMVQNRCGSCNNYTIPDIDLNFTPVITYSDSCNGFFNFFPHDACLGITTEPPPPPTVGPFYCPDNSECFGCPLDFGKPNFTYVSTIPTPGYCDLTISWDWEYDPIKVDNPSFDFACLYDANDDCPDTRSCKGCLEDGNFPHINYKGLMKKDGTCSVIFEWNWKSQEINSLLSFDCHYANGESCNNDQSSTCGSCQNFVLTDLNIDLNPFVTINDHCGHDYHLQLLKICRESISSSFSINFEEEYYCPPFSQCSGCPSDWDIPTFHAQGTIVAQDICDLNIAWDWMYSGTGANPNLLFRCIYAANGKFCDDAISICASCGNVTLYGLQILLDPYINYSDTCSNIAQYQIESCGDFTSPPHSTQQFTHQTNHQTTQHNSEGTTLQPTQETPHQTTESKTQQTAQQTTQQPTQQTVHQSTQQPTQQTDQQSTQQPTQQTAQQTTQQPTQQTVHQSTQQPTQQTVQQSTQQPTQQTVEQSTQQPTQQTAQQTTQQPTQQTVQQSTQQPTQQTVQQSTQQPTQQTVQQTTHHPTQETAQQTTEKSTQHTNQHTSDKPTQETTSKQITKLTTHHQSTEPIPDCPRICSGCPQNFAPPLFNQNGVVLQNNQCNLTITWDYPYPTENEEVKMTFSCVYKNGQHCKEETDEEVCGSCQRFFISQIKMDEDPTLHYFDPCGYSIDFAVTSDCYS